MQQVSDGVRGSRAHMTVGICWWCGASAVLNDGSGRVRCLLCGRGPGDQALEALRQTYRQERAQEMDDWNLRVNGERYAQLAPSGRNHHRNRKETP